MREGDRFRARERTACSTQEKDRSLCQAEKFQATEKEKEKAKLLYSIFLTLLEQMERSLAVSVDERSVLSVASDCNIMSTWKHKKEMELFFLWRSCCGERMGLQYYETWNRQEFDLFALWRRCCFVEQSDYQRTSASFSPWFLSAVL